MEEKDSKLEVFPGVFVGDIVVSLEERVDYRNIGDMFQVLPNSTEKCLYYEYSISSLKMGITHNSNSKSWRKATPEEVKDYNKGIRNLSITENKPVEDELIPQIGEWYVVLDTFEKEDTLGKCYYSQGEVFQVVSLQKSNVLKSKWWLHKDDNKAIGLGSCRKALESEIPKKSINLEGRYIKVLDDVGKTHYPCFKGDYLLFSRKVGNYEYWGEKGVSQYHGLNVHLNPDFELMPEDFVPPNNMNVMEEQYKPWSIRYFPEWTEELFNATIKWCESIREKHPWQVIFEVATSDYTLKGLKNCITGGGYICFWGPKKKEEGAMYLYGINNNPDSLRDKTITISQLKTIINYKEPKVTDIETKNDNLLEEAKIKYPKGTKYKQLQTPYNKSQEGKIAEAYYTPRYILIEGLKDCISAGEGYIYLDGKWAEIVNNIIEIDPWEYDEIRTPLNKTGKGLYQQITVKPNLQINAETTNIKVQKSASVTLKNTESEVKINVKPGNSIKI
jgi:hypothetical protein